MNKKFSHSIEMETSKYLYVNESLHRAFSKICMTHQSNEEGKEYSIGFAFKGELV